MVEQITFDQIMGINPEYDEFVEKFKPRKTTDDCYTPASVYNAVCRWVEKEYGVEKKNFVRPFYPGGDFENFPYKECDIVVDNPPFSMISRIIRYYVRRRIPFFLFAPALTLFSAGEMSVTYIPADCTITYENGAVVKTGFVTNMDDCLVRSAPGLHEAVKLAEEEKKAKRQPMPKYEYPDNVVTASMVQKYSRYGIEHRLKREAAVFIRKLDEQSEAGKSVFGSGFLTGFRAAAERAAAERAAAERAEIARWNLSERERRIAREIDAKCEGGGGTQ